MESTKRLNSIIREDVAPFVAGAFVFYGTLGVSTCVQKVLGISTGTKMLARVAGIPTVCFASIASDRCSSLCQEWARNPQIGKNMPSSLRILGTSSKTQGYYEFKGVKLPKRDVHTCLFGMGAFKVLGGRFWAIAPSSYTAPGTQARIVDSIPATEKYISAPQRRILESVYKKHGCHTCGSKAGTPIGDHMPCKAIGSYMKNPKYRFYAHCQSCSNTQGGIMRAATAQLKELNLRSNAQKVKFLQAAGGGRAAYNHGVKPRLNHLVGGLNSFHFMDKNTLKLPRFEQVRR